MCYTVFNKHQSNMISFLWKCCFYGVVLITISSGIVAYNFDVNNVIIYEEAIKSEAFRKSYHGFSVALWNPGYGELNQSWIFIGAPRANSTALYPGINEPGTVLKCKIGEPCKEWTMNQPEGRQLGDGSWLGGTMGIENGINASITVCGPRWLDKTIHFNKQYAWPMSGICYQARVEELSKSDLMNGVSLYPLQGIWSAVGDVEYYVMAESGFSMHIVPDASRNVIFGCPGLSSGHGTPIRYNFKGQSFLIPKPPVYKSESTVQHYDYSGYAVTSGYYFGKNKGRFYASSAPRSADLYGRIILFTFPVRNGEWINIKDQRRGNQVGEYFGAALASCDINGDKYDDLIVGAPQWTKIVDEGRIYIYKGAGDHLATISEESPDFHGEMPRARFGSTITCLGDIDLDGYQDIAVGAPYHDGKGAVYIYHGSTTGLRLTQKIAPKDTKGFGISISQPSDIDNNGYGDIAVGAYLSGRVTVFRSKRAVNTMVKLTTDLPQGSLQQNASSFDVKICSSYGGKGAPKKLNVITELKVDESLQRGEITANGENLHNYVYQFSDTLNLNSESCKDFTIKMKTGDKHYLEILKLSAIQNLKNNNDSGTLVVDKQHVSGQQHFDSSFDAVINELHSTTKSYLEVVFALECNNSCNSNLIIAIATSLENDNTYVIGSDQNIELNISASNSGDQAFRAQAIVIIPFPIRLTQIPSSSCTRLPIGKDTQVTWDIANPLNKDESRNVTLILDMSPVTSNTTKITLNATATTQSNNTAAVTSGNDKARLRINCETQTDIGIIRKNTLDRYPYTVTEEDEQVQSIAFQQIYEIKNYEVTRIDQAQLSLSIPTHWIEGGNQIEIVRINKTNGYLDGQELYCKDVGTDADIISSSYDATTMTRWLSEQTPDENFQLINGKIFSASPDNRTININCTNPSVKCKMINCLLGPFTSTQSVAKLALMFDLVLANFTSGIIQNEDIILFVTNGSVSVLGTPGETVDNKPNLIMIGTKFTESPMGNRVPRWVIAVSVLVGLLLLILVIIALFKFGFFKRNKQMELRALLEEKDEAAPGAAPTSTSAG